MYYGSIIKKTAILSVLFFILECSAFQTKPESTAHNKGIGSVYVQVPMVQPDELFDLNRPILRVEMVDFGKGRIAPVPYIYGYPFYGSDEAKIGIQKFRHDNWTGYSRQESIDKDGVAYLKEDFPTLSCTFYGILETKQKYIPMYLECKLPPERNLGGSKRPIIGKATTGASRKEILEEPSLRQAFLGDWHAVTLDFEKGNGTGYFNTEHGQLGFGFKSGKLQKIIYMFDPPIKNWQSPELWMAP